MTATKIVYEYLYKTAWQDQTQIIKATGLTGQQVSQAIWSINKRGVLLTRHRKFKTRGRFAVYAVSDYKIDFRDLTVGDRVSKHLAEHPHQTAAEIAEATGLLKPQVRQVLKRWKHSGQLTIERKQAASARGKVDWINVYSVRERGYDGA